MSIKALSEYTVYAKYAKYNTTEKRRETWKEQVSRAFKMFEKKYKHQLDTSTIFAEMFEQAKMAVIKKQVLGSQRALQFGGKSIEDHNDKMYNCAVTYIDRCEVFNQIMYMLLCGCGVGFSVQYKHIEKLPPICKPSKGVKEFVVEDSIEGWADAIGVLVNSFFVNTDKFEDYRGYDIEYNFSKIRPAGSMISGGFKAPGSDGLRSSINKIQSLITRRLFCGESKLRPIDYYDIIMHASDAVLSGGVRRSATICIFSANDDDMLKAKTGNWFYENPQRGRSNNSALLLRDTTTCEQFSDIMESVKQFGEPGFVWSTSEDTLYNPCVEIGFHPRTSDGRSGVQYCNLTEINGKKCSSKEDFLHACRMSAIVGTMQAGFTDFKYLGSTTEEIVRGESLLGCSITGMMDNPDVLFDKETQREGAELIKRVNKEVASIIGINPAARTTCVKPAGTTSCVLGTASGIHPHHAKRYFRRVQANKFEFPLQEFQRINPQAVEESVWSTGGTDMVITFLCEVPPGSITKNAVSAIDLLSHVKFTQENWVEYGTNEELCTDNNVRHNVSNTITVQPDEWEGVTKYIFENRYSFAGVSILPASGDKDYPQAPFCTVYTPAEIVKEYGNASVFASGVIVHALAAFNDNLWVACDAVLQLSDDTKLAADCSDWIRRANSFADRYFDGDVKRMTYCLKDVHNWKTWCDLNRDYQEVDWVNVIENNPFYEDINTTGAQACQGNQCEINI